ncbi:NUDIX hydrolase [Halorussus amylolyticus]|uniref:NUDIX hydrolase n=1 Tax=Halorussus amylolyticus TaxID=1126242 RepID=UPI001EE4794B|nr:NUDIX hydrolase [Halorussus amylolyticus]
MTRIDLLRDRESVSTSEETIRLDSESFETVRENVTSGLDRWVGALVRDDDNRIALVRNRWSDGWVLPGGNVESGETLREAVAREVREETGLAASVERPVEVVEQTFVSGDDAVRGHFVVFDARTEDAELGDDLGVDDSEIEAAGWFADVPDDARDPALLRRHFG